MAIRRGFARDQEAHNDICELIDNLDDQTKQEVLDMLFERYGDRMGGRDRSRASGDTWGKRRTRDEEPPDLGVRGDPRNAALPGQDAALSERTARRLAHDEANRRKAAQPLSEERYPGVEKRLNGGEAGCATLRNPAHTRLPQA